MAFGLRPNNMHYVVFVLLFCVNLSDGFSGGDINQDTVIPFKNEDYVINETIRIQDNATLTLESGVTLRFRENHGMIVHGALIANGTDKSPITFRSLSDETEKVGYTRQFSRKTVRLVDGGAPNQGRLEVLYNGIWGTVCDDEWSDVNTEVACRGLGFTSGVFTSVFGPGRGPIWMDDVQCRQTDLGLEECSHPGFGVHNCGHLEDVGLICSGLIKDEFSSPKFPWHGINFLSSSPSKHQNLESYLVNVNIYNVWEHNVNLSSLQAAIVSNTIFPYTKNVKIARSLKAVVIHDRHIDKQEVILNGINIEDCPIGIHVINSTTNSSSIIQGNFSTPFIHLEKIKIKRCIKALSIENHLTKNISLNDITITSCVNGIDAKFIETLSQASEMTPMNHATSYAHYMNKIKITECYNAIHIYNPSTKDIHLSKITVVNCSFGIDVENSMFSRFTVQTTQIRTGQSGIGFRSLPASMQLARSTGLCDSVDYNVTYPLEVRLLSYKHSRSCKKTFTTRLDHVLYIYVKSLQRRAGGKSCNLTIIDIRTSEYLYNTEVIKWNRHYKLIRSTGNEITVGISHAYYTDGELYIFSRPAKSGKPVLRISGTVMRRLTGNALTLSNFLQDAVVTDLETGHCAVAVGILKKTSFFSNILFNNITIFGASDKGIYARADNLKLKLLNSTVKNSKSGVCFERMTKSSVFIIKNVLKNNSKAILKDSFDDGTFTVTNNTFVSNRDGGIKYASMERCTGQISENVFERNAGYAIFLESSSVVVMEIRQNEFISNTGGVIVDLNSDSSSSVTNIFRNIWQNNTGLAMIRLNKLDVDTGKISSFHDNKLTENVVNHRYPMLPQQLVEEAVIVHVQGRFKFNHNVLENPSSRYEFVIQSRYKGKTVDASFNWWGTKDPDVILSKVFDFVASNDLDKVNFVPYLSSLNEPNQTLNQTPNFIFRNGSRIGGPLIRNLVLTKNQSPYLVTRDVMVYPNVTLSIQPGIQLNVLPHLGFHVYGKMEILGKADDFVKFNIGYYGSGETKRSRHPLRLVGGNKPWEGRVEVYYNDIWGNICRNDWSDANGEILCKQLGFQRYLRTISLSQSSSFQPSWLKSIKCRLGFHTDITSCPFEGWRVTCSSYSEPLAVRCDPGYWRGIRFSEIAMPSKLTYVKFERGGSYVPQNEFNFVLQFDAQKQTAHGITINDFGAYAMNLLIPNQGITFSDITIDNGHSSSGLALQSRSFSLSLRDSKVRMSHRRSWDGLGISLGRNQNAHFSEQRMSHIQSIVPFESSEQTDICSFRKNETVMGEDSFVSLSIGGTEFSLIDTECVHVLHILSKATITIYSAQSSSSSGFLQITGSYPSNRNSTTFTLSPPFNDVFVTGPGVIYLKFFSKGESSEGRVDVFVLTSKDVRTLPITKGSVKLENVTISDCDEALDIQSWTHSTPVLEIENCKFENNNKGLTSENSKLNFVLKSSLLKNNNYGVNIVNKAGVLLMTGKIESCSMTEHLSSAIYLDDNSYLNISILRSTFERNVKTMVYHSGTFNQYIFMYENDIKFTRREAIQVIFNRVPNVFDLGIRDNAFVQNWDKVIDVRSGDLRFAKVCAVKIQSNTFTGNVPSGITSGILFIGFQGLIEISNNDFRDNQCNFVCKFDLLGKTRGSGQHASFVNNVVENNYGFSRNFPGNRINKVSRFAIGIFGCVFQSFSVNHNIFNNQQMDKELLVGREGDSEDNKSQVNATHNWWGTSAVDEIENRIFDFSLEDWSDRDLVKSLPAFIFRNFTHLSETAISPNNSVLGGFINFPKQLTADNSPYVVERDLTVGRNANITIDRGVTLLFKPRVGLLVLGNIFAMGSTDEPIRFCSSTDRCKEKQQNPKPCSNLRISRRSNSRDENYLEIFIKNSWKHICGENFDLISAKVACRELGFGDVQSFTTEYCYPTAVSMYEKSFQCSGSERSLLNCATLHDDCYRHYCVNLACKPGYTWGNIRISSFNNDISTVNDDTSVLQNVLIDNSGSLYNGEKGPSVQIINRSPGIRHVRITNSGAGGIQIISPKSLQILENVTVNPGCSSSGIEIIGNRGSVIVTKSRIFRSRSSALVMMPMKNIALAPSYLGLPNLCGCQSRLFVNGRSYLYLSGHKFGQNERQCSKVVYSSKKTILILRVLNRPSYSSYSSAIEVYDGSAANFTRIARFDNWNRHQDYSEFQTSSNSMFLKASYGRLEKGFLAEIIVVNETDIYSSLNIEYKAEYKIIANHFYENEGAAIEFTEDWRTSSKLTMARNEITSSGRREQETKPSVLITAENNDSIEIANNFIHKNFQGGIHVNTKSSSVKCTILNNVINFNINGSESILLKSPDDASPHVTIAGNKLVQNNLNQSVDLLHVKNFRAEIIENVFLGNLMRYVLNWDTSYSGKGLGICEKNTFSMNAGYLQTIVLQGSKKIIKKNYIVNPGNYFEIAVFPNYHVTDIADQFDARFNWWGYDSRDDIQKRIRDTSSRSDIPVVVVDPFLVTPPETFNRGLCPFGWSMIGRACYYYHGGAAEFKIAHKLCQKKGAKLLQTSKEDIVERRAVKKLLDMRMFLESKIPEVWTDTFSEKITETNCWITDGNSFFNTTCQTLYPSICRKEAELDCLNSCFHNGVCNGRTCVCNKGYEGEDCSRFHCKDVGNCGRYGTCVGPNYCRCRLGWKGRGCTVSYCPPLTSCKSCLTRKGCGWCDEQRRCLPGTAYRSDVGRCKSWFYYQCLSVGNNPRCSDEIKIIDCSSRLCNYTFQDSSLRTCQQCVELGKCFGKKIDSNKGFCNTWNETRCPQGFVLKDYSDESRINNIVPSKKLKLITGKEATLYKCPAKRGSVIVAKKDVLIGNSGDIISSTQAQGILHKVSNVAYQEKYQLLKANPASLSEAVSYSDFNQKVQLEQLAGQDQLEDKPDENLVSSFLSGTVKLNGSTIHTIGNNVNVFKSVGNEYSLESQQDTANSIYLTMPSTSLKSSIKVGDVVVGKQSNGFLEKVVDVTDDGGNSFVHTELARGGGTIQLGRVKKVNKQQRRCTGGDNLQGLNIVGGKVNLKAGDTIVGRPSGSFLGKVLNSYTDNDNNVIAEVSTVVRERNGHIESRLDFSRARNVRRRKRDLKVKIAEPKFQLTVERDVKIEGESSHLNIRGGVSFTPKVKVSLDISDFTMKSVGVVMSGGASLFVGATYKFGSGSGKRKSMSYNLLKDKDAGSFSIKLPEVGYVSGRFLFDVKLKIDLKADIMAHGSISVDVSSFADLTMGGIWRKGHGVENVFESNATLSNFSVSDLDKGTAYLSVVLIPSFKVQWPKPIKLGESIVKETSTVLKDIFDAQESDHIPSFLKVSINTPIKAYLESVVCSEKCQDPGKNLEANVRGGLSAMNGNIVLKLGQFQEDWPLLSSKALETSSSECIKVPRNTPCCGNMSNPGKVNPRTKKCEPICNCSGIDPTRLGITLRNGKCECEVCPIGSTNCQCKDDEVVSNTGECKSKTCPDGSPRKKRSVGKPECPCICADGSEREMIANRSCPCYCTCSDGSKDTIASDGSCPCVCRCKGFETSTTGPSGCKCENDRCPICRDDEVAVWVNRKCLCREKYDCGLPPVCVDGRKGPKCLQPDCGLCKGCSGNGICQTSSSCESRCVCNWRWEGECCDRRIPRRVWGDPHLETLDGVAFDYFGIGEFWDCKSVINNFGIQTRFYAYNGASLTGAVALKAGASVVTLTTCSKCSSTDFPTLRIDGNIQSISVGRRIMLANETVTLDVQNPGNVTNSNGTSLIVFAFQYKSGVSVSINVGYSPKMSRQYINVQFTPIASFLRQTEGICGFMDDDPNNDLIGPNGEAYNDPLVFTDSWRVNATHQNSGTFGSWSWNSSNFHVDDVMDKAYTDTNHRPMYSLKDLPKEIVDKANASCMKLGLENNLLRNCIFDISLTNDTSFLEQQSLKLGCPNECSGKGLCDNATCSCLEGWSGTDCSVGKCGNCSRGKCEGGFCQCEIGWEGAACDRQATCYEVSNCTSPIQGRCLTTNKCLCNTGYIGLNCSIRATCYNVQNCSSHGACVAVDKCKCDVGWNGTTCEELSCEALGYCSGNGQCVAFDVCQCNSGWTGPSCAIFDCKELNHCSKNGQCVGPNVCDCFDGYQGDSCNASLNCSSLGDCSQNGVCVMNKELKSVCSCFLGYMGSNCSLYDCSGVENCSGKGKCIQPNLCECDEGYEGQSCSNFTCEKLNRCSGRGSCVKLDECLCISGWSGQSCDTPNCDGVNNCSSNGTCIAPNKCECYSMYDGERCDQRLQTNLNTPIFTESIYNATVMENRQRGHHVLTVFANDSDPGRSGKVGYSLVDNSISSHFIIDKDTGRIYTTQKFDFETLSQTRFAFTIAATDDGSPKRSSEGTVIVNVQDENDNCPVFQTMPTSINIPLESKPKFTVATVQAQDADSGKNGQIKYDIDKETNPYQFFEIGIDDGRLFVNKTLQSGKYSLTIVARDLGDNPCIREIFLTIVVDAAILLTSSSIATTVGSSLPLTSATVHTAVQESILTTPMSIAIPTRKSKPTQTTTPTAISILITTSTPKKSTLTSTMEVTLVSTPLPTSINTATSRPTPTSTLTSTSTETPTSTLIQTPSSSPATTYTRQTLTLTLTHTPTNTPLPTLTQTSAPIPLSKPIATSTPTLRLMLTPPIAPKLTSTSTPVATLTQVPTQTWAFTPKLTTPAQESKSTATTISAQAEPLAETLPTTMSSPTVTSTLMQPRRTQTTTPTPTSTPIPTVNPKLTSASEPTQTATSKSKPTSISTLTKVRIQTQTQTSIRKPISTQTLSFSSPVAISTSELPASTSTISKFFLIEVRLTSRVFDERLQNSSTVTYKYLQNELLDALTPHFKEIEGFVAISLVRFRNGSVVAELSVAFLSPSNEVDEYFLRQTIINAADARGNIGQLTFDIFFLENSVRRTTEELDDTKDDFPLPDSAIGIISGAVLLIILAVVFGCCYCLRRNQESKSLDSRAHENVRLADDSFKESAKRTTDSMYGEHSV